MKDLLCVIYNANLNTSYLLKPDSIDELGSAIEKSEMN